MRLFARTFAELSDPNRLRNVDVLRGVAILDVVFLHFDMSRFFYGYLGVDLFFVLSGFLVSGPLIDKFERNSQLSAGDFWLRRAFRILPSYFAFLLVAGLSAFALYHTTHPELVLRVHELPRYIAFFYNYKPLPNFIFNHVWSLCVEEHFYVLLPITFLICQRWQLKPRACLWSLIGAVIAVKIALFFRNGYFAYAVTHGRLDALAFGVLARYAYATGSLRGLQGRVWVAALGLGSFLGAVGIDCWLGPLSMFHKVWFHVLFPVSCTAMLFGTLGWRFRGSLPLRFISFYSYNWYLWHLLLSTFIFDSLGKGSLGFVAYVGSGLGLAVLANHLIEQPALEFRKPFSAFVLSFFAPNQSPNLESDSRVQPFA